MTDATLARLKTYRSDKTPAETDTIESIRSLLHGRDAQDDAGGVVPPWDGA